MIKKESYSITGMTCSACSSHIEKTVSDVDGVTSVNVNLLKNTMTVNYDDTLTNDNTIIKSVETSGYGASLLSNADSSKGTNAEASVPNRHKEMLRRLWISLAFLIPLFYISMGHMLGAPLPEFLTSNSFAFAFTQLLLTLPIIYVNMNYFTSGFKSLFKGAPNMNSLIAIGSTAAMVYSIYAIYRIGFSLSANDHSMAHSFAMKLYFESAGMILTLITLGKMLESRAKSRTTDAISSLLKLAPQTAIVVRNEKEVEIDSKEVIVGDIVIIKPAASIPVDGVVIEGSSSIDESALTGESIPVEKSKGDTITAGTLNKTGYFKMQATRVGEDTTLSKIINLVEEASSSKAPISKLADRVSRVFVPIVIVIAVVSFIVWLLLGYQFEFAMSVGIAVLVISCPCALGLATPTAIMVATGKGAQNGILIKSAESLETLHEVKTVALDKTGTITEGKPAVTDVITLGDKSEHELLQIAYSIENASEHPLADAIIEYAKQNGIEPNSLDSFEYSTGQGLKAVVNGVTYYAGNQKLMQSIGVGAKTAEERGEMLANQGKTPMYFSDEQQILGIIAVMDKIKNSSILAISELKKQGIKTVMLTGDNTKTAQAVKAAVGVDEVIAEVMPSDKEKHISRLMESGRVCMIGDGINDSPALARADVGMAIGAGTDVAIDAADIVLMKSDLLDAVTAIRLSGATIRNIKQNLFWALIYNVIGIPIAAGVFFLAFDWLLDPMYAAAAMSFSSIFVVFNALRLKFFKSKYLNKKPLSNADSIKNYKKEEKAMQNKKEIIIEGMSCGHCSARVEKALNGIEGVESAVVTLEDKKAEVQICSAAVTDEILRKTVTDAGYEVVSIK